MTNANYNKMHLQKIPYMPSISRHSIVCKSTDETKYIKKRYKSFARITIPKPISNMPIDTCK